MPKQISQSAHASFDADKSDLDSKIMDYYRQCGPFEKTQFELFAALVASGRETMAKDVAKIGEHPDASNGADIEEINWHRLAKCVQRDELIGWMRMMNTAIEEEHVHAVAGIEALIKRRCAN